MDPCTQTHGYEWWGMEGMGLVQQRWQWCFGDDNNDLYGARNGHEAASTGAARLYSRTAPWAPDQGRRHEWIPRGERKSPFQMWGWNSSAELLGSDPSILGSWKLQ